MSDYLPAGDRVTFIPQIYSRIILGNPAPWYNNLIGGDMAGRYLDQQLPFIGLQSPLCVSEKAGIARLDVRWNFIGNFYLYGIANYIISADRFENFFTGEEDYHGSFGAALRLAWKTPIGPVSVDLTWNDITSRIGAYLNIGFTF